MKFVLAVVLFLICNLALSQNYYSKIIPFEHEDENISPNAFSLEIFNGELIIANIYAGNNSTLTRVDLMGNVLENIIHMNFDFSHDPFSVIENELFIFAKDRELQNDLRLKNVNTQHQELFEKKYSSPGDSSFPTGSKSIDGNIYLTSIFKFDQNDPYQTHIKKLDINGEVIWEKNIGENYSGMVPYKITEYDSASLIIASSAFLDFDRISVVHKVSTDGEVEWVHESSELPFITAIEGLVTLGNEIVLSNIVDRGDSIDFQINNYHPLPPKLSWINSEGEFIKEYLFITDISDELYISELKKGLGPYFFGFGVWTDEEDDESYAWLFKMNENGELLWERRYQHPAFYQNNYRHLLKDIKELPSGDIVLLISAKQTNLVGEIVIARVNENGCFGEQSCEDVEIFSSTKEDYQPNLLTIFPNPAKDFITLNYKNFAKAEITNIEGRKVSSYDLNSTKNQINVSGLSSGLYYLKLIDNSGLIGIGKFIKI